MEAANLEATKDLFDLWMKMYEASFGRLADAPIVGPTRERAEKARGNYETAIRLYSSWLESSASFQSVFLEATRKTREKIVAEVGQEGLKTESYRDFYNTWMETYSETFKEFLKSKYFAEDLSKLTSNSMDYTRSNREMLEENLLKPMNLPTRSELDEIDKELYELKKSQKELAKRLREIESKI